MLKVIQGNHFFTDHHIWLHNIQSSCYSAFLAFVLDEVKRRLVYAQKLLMTDLKFITNIEQCDSVDQRVFFDFYNLLALRYRLLNPMIHQLDLFQPNEFISVQTTKWSQWYVNEIRDLLDNPVFCRHVAVLFGFGNQLVGDHAEHFIGKHLVNAYQLFDQCPTSYFVDLYQ